MNILAEDRLTANSHSSTGATPGGQTIALLVEGVFDDSQPVTLNPGAVETVTFTVTRDEGCSQMLSCIGGKRGYRKTFPHWLSGLALRATDQLNEEPGRLKFISV